MIEYLEGVQSTPPATPDRLRRTGFAAAAIAVALLVPAAALDLTRFLANWLVLLSFVLSIGLGSLFLVGLEYTVRARWSVPFRRIWENMAALIPVSVILLIPVLLGMHSLYEWTHAEVVAADPILAKKTAYLNVPFFLARLGLYFLIWLAFLRVFARNSVTQDVTGDEDLTRKNIRMAPVFLILFAFTTTFAGIDLLMTLTPHWFSTMFGLAFAVNAIVAGLAAGTLVAVWSQRAGMLPARLRQDSFYNLGALLFAMNTFWCYLAFSQFMLIWYGNLPLEMTWYRARYENGWFAVSLAMIAVQFIVPFAALLSRSAKMDFSRLRWVCVWILCARYLDLYWTVLPSVPGVGGSPFSWKDLWAPILAVGIGVFVWIWRASRVPLVPVRDSRLRAGLDFHL